MKKLIFILSLLLTAFAVTAQESYYLDGDLVITGDLDVGGTYPGGAGESTDSLWNSITVIDTIYLNSGKTVYVTKDGSNNMRLVDAFGAYTLSSLGSGASYTAGNGIWIDGSNEISLNDSIIGPFTLEVVGSLQIQNLVGNTAWYIDDEYVQMLGSLAYIEIDDINDDIEMNAGSETFRMNSTGMFFEDIPADNAETALVAIDPTTKQLSTRTVASISGTGTSDSIINLMTRMDSVVAALANKIDIEKVAYMKLDTVTIYSVPVGMGRLSDTINCDTEAIIARVRFSSPDTIFFIQSNVIADSVNLAAVPDFYLQGYVTDDISQAPTAIFSSPVQITGSNAVTTGVNTTTFGGQQYILPGDYFFYWKMSTITAKSTAITITVKGVRLNGRT